MNSVRVIASPERDQVAVQFPPKFTETIFLMTPETARDLAQALELAVMSVTVGEPRSILVEARDVTTD